ncbi:MAG: response regulator [Proteobacteria bacterium]|nr:response regulator [Pseudomonadota bacterium]
MAIESTPARPHPERQLRDEGGEREFEIALSKLTRRVLNSSVEGIDDAIRRGLEQAMRMAGADQVGLHAFDPTGGRPPDHYTWNREYKPRDARHIRAFRWAAERVLKGEVLHIPDVSHLPADADAERTDLKARGILSLLGLPVRSGGRLVGYLAFECTATPRVWTEREIARLGVVAEIFSSALHRKRAEEALRQQIAGESRLGTIAMRLLACEADDLVPALRDSLRDLAEQVGADRVVATAGAESRTEEPRLRVEWRSDSGSFNEARRLPPDSNSPSFLAVPLLAGLPDRGAVLLESRRPGRFSSSEERALIRLAVELFAIALRRHWGEVDLRETQAQLTQAQKLESVGRLVGGVAHDFNNLLTVIGVNAKSLLAELPEGHCLRADAEDIGRAAEAATQLTRQLMSFSRRDEPVVPTEGVDSAIGSLEPMLRRLVREDISLVVDLGAGASAVRLEPGPLQQVLVNLIVNAGDAMPTGGVLVVRTAIEQVGDERARDLRVEPGEKLRLEVSDTGIGMEDQVRERAFEPFFTTKPPDKGTGLGLSIIDTIVRRAEGAVDVSSQPGLGTTFAVYLPLCELSPVRAASEEPVYPPAGAECLLVVEDEPAVRHLVCRILRRAGYRVLEAGDGKEALSVAARYPAEIHALVTDVVMPLMRGGELARQLRRQRPETRVLFLSGYPDEPESQESLRSHAFLAKPFSEQQLLSVLRGVLDATA